jgi:hypothetical protein
MTTGLMIAVVADEQPVPTRDAEGVRKVIAFLGAESQRVPWRSFALDEGQMPAATGVE